jgi:hypothetical protein
MLWAVLVLCTVVAAGAVPGAHAQAGQARLLYFAFPGERPAWLLPVRVVLWEGASPYRDVLDALCRGPEAGVLASVLPRGTRVERLTVRDGLATVELRLGRAELRALALQAIAHTLCQFPEVKRVVVKVGERRWAGSDSNGLAPDPRVVFSGFPDLRGDAQDGAILALTLRGVFAGYPDGMFRPQAAVSRAEAIKSLVEALRGRGLPVGMFRATADTGFSDVPRDHWVLPYLVEAMRRGILPQPRDQGPFAPGDLLDGVTLGEWLRRAGGQGLDPAVAESLAHSWAEQRQITRAEWAGLLARLLRVGGPDLWVVSPAAQDSLEGGVLVIGTTRSCRGRVGIVLMDSRGRELASRSVLLEPGPAGSGPGWFAEWLQFLRPLTSSAGVIEVTYWPPEEEEPAGTVLRLPVLIR